MPSDREVALEVLHQFHRAIANPPRHPPNDTMGRVPHVTGSICECDRQMYYQLTSRGMGGGIDHKGAIRTWIGRELHQTNVLGGEMEMSMQWKEGDEVILQGTLDELSPDQTLILDKKTTRNTPRYAYPHHKKQVELYNLLLTKAKGITATYGVILYINVDNTDILPSAWRLDVKGMPALEKKILARHSRMKDYIAKGILPPRTIQPWNRSSLVGTVCLYCSSYGRCWNEEFMDPRFRRKE